jgi:hypothetical protein
VRSCQIATAVGQSCPRQTYCVTPVLQQLLPRAITRGIGGALAEHLRIIFALWEDSAHALAATGSQDINGVWEIFCNQGMNTIFLGDVMGRVGPLT